MWSSTYVRLANTLLTLSRHRRRVSGALQAGACYLTSRPFTGCASVPSSPSTQRSELLLDIRARHLLRIRGEAVLGARNWRLFYRYGRVMHGPFSGQYVSGIPSASVHQLLDALFRGERIAVHLMHNHMSGNYESSALVLINSELVMKFTDRKTVV